jgi:hypothetical protein
MRAIGLLLAALLGLSAQAPAPASAPVRQLEYQFGFNTKPASQGQGTGTTTIDILGPAADGTGLMVSGSDFWWNTARARATNTCEVHPNGGVSCSQRPYAISPIQLAIFSLLGRDYFKGLSGSATSSWKKTYKITAAIAPGATSPFASYPTTWNCVANLQGKGPASGGRLVIVGVTGTVDQQGGRYGQGTFKTGIAYDPVAKIPVQIDDTRTHLPQTSVYNKDYVGLKLLKDSQAHT